MLFIGGDWDGYRTEVRADIVAIEVESAEGDFVGRELYAESEECEEPDSRYFVVSLCGFDVMLAEGLDVEDAMLMLIENYPS